MPPRVCWPGIHPRAATLGQRLDPIHLRQEINQLPALPPLPPLRRLNNPILDLVTKLRSIRLQPAQNVSGQFTSVSASLDQSELSGAGLVIQSIKALCRSAPLVTPSAST